MSNEPKWLAKARELVGLTEIVGSKNEKKVVDFFKEAGHPEVRDDETAWCAAFANAMLARSGIKGTGKINARSFLDWGEKLDKPRVGCIVVFKRGNSAWQGHVAFFLRTVGDQIEILGGNQGNAVSIARRKKGDLLGYRWPDEPATTIKVAVKATLLAGKASTSPAVGPKPLPPIPTAQPGGMTADQIEEARKVANAQKKLRELGYYGVGMVDGEQTPKGMTDSAVLNFKNRNDLPPGGPFTTAMDAEFFAALAVAAPIEVGAERATMTVSEVREASPELAPALNSTWWQKVVAAIGAAGGAIGTLFGGVVQNIGGATEKLQPVKEFLGDIPAWTWGVLVVAIAVGLFLMARHTAATAAKLYNKGVVT